MPGMLGIVAREPDKVLKNRVSRGIKKLVRKPWHYQKPYINSPLGVAVALRKSCLEGSDLWISPKNDLVVAVDGELYGGPKPKEKAVKPIRQPTSRCGAYIGSLYRELGAKWVEKVRGAFSVAIWDSKKKEIWLFVDRYGLRPLYYSQKGKGFLFGSSMAAFTAAWPEIFWKINLDAVADFFTFEHVLGEKSFIIGVELVPNAGFVQYKLANRGITKGIYWSLNQIRPHKKISFDNAARKACRLFDRAIAEQASPNEHPGVYLTSGLDSRTIVGFLKRYRQDFTTYTYGIRGCRDVVWGKALARCIGSKHRTFLLDNGSWVFRYAPEFVAASESFVNCFHSHGINTYQTAKNKIDVHLSGIGGGSFAGGDTTSIEALRAGTFCERSEEMYKNYRFVLSHVYQTPLEQDYLFKPEFRASLRGRGEVSFLREFEKYKKLRTDVVGDAFTLNNRYKKAFAYLITVERNYFENRTPFMDYQFLDFIFSLPTSLRLHRQLQLGMLDYALPKLTLVPWQETTLLPTRREWLQRSHRWGRRIGLRVLRAFQPQYSLPSEPGRNYPQWLCKHGLGWAQEIINSNSLAKRGIFEKTYLKELLGRIPLTIKKQDYKQQRSLTYRIGAAITFELMCRRVFDRKTE